MSESSEDKSKRTFIKYIENNKWEHQYSVFFNNYADSLNIIENMKKVKRSLKREFSTVAILYRVCLKNCRTELLEDVEDGSSRVTPYFTFFTSEKISFTKVCNSIENTVEISVKVKSQVLTAEKIKSYVLAVVKQKPHDLKKYLGKDKVNRIGLINRVKLVPAQGGE